MLGAIVIDVYVKPKGGHFVAVPARGLGRGSLLVRMWLGCRHGPWRCQVQVYSGRGSGQVRTETDEGEGQRLDKGLVQLELGLIGFNDKGIEH